MENINAQDQSLNESEEVVLETTQEEVQDDNVSQDLATQLKAERDARLKAEEVAKNQRIRAEKAEKLAKSSTKEEVKAEAAQGMTTRDVIALTKANIHEDDISEVEEYAKFKNISVADALKSSVVKTLIKEKEEMRKTANVANTSNARRSQVRPTGQDLIAKAVKGETVDDIEALAQARMEARKNASKR